MRGRRIEICGGIASGKTTLCNLIHGAGIQASFEKFQDNPFWHLFNAAPERFAFETEVTFLLQHYCQIKMLQDGMAVCDFALLQDRAYAEVNLRSGQLKAFQSVYQQVEEELPPPMTLVHLECSAEEELRRIQKRARAEERGIGVEYLDALNRQIYQAVNRCTGTRIIKINSEEKDFVTDRLVQQRVLATILNQ